MKPIKSLVKSLFHKVGYEVSLYRPLYFGESPMSDIEKLIHKGKRQILFDVGGNVGQTVEAFQDILPEADIHSFEPSDAAFPTLEERHGANKKIFLNKVAIGSKIETKLFFENSQSVMSSFLPLGEDGWGKVVTKKKLNIISLDAYCQRKNIGYISVLKTDAQGFDLEVLKGTQHLISNNKVQLILIEVTFAKLYQDSPSFSEIYQYLIKNNYKLVTFYKIHYQNNFACWTDALFINPNFKL